MLTKAERQWFENRCNYCDWCSLQYSSNDCYRCIGNDECPIYPMTTTAWSAAEFEARVAAKLAEFYHHTTLYLDDSDGQKLRCWETCPARFYCGDSYTHLTCGDAVLKAAQLAVEEEMDGQTNA